MHYILFLADDLPLYLDDNARTQFGQQKSANFGMHDLSTGKRKIGVFIPSRPNSVRSKHNIKFTIFFNSRR